MDELMEKLKALSNEFMDKANKSDTDVDRLKFASQSLGVDKAALAVLKHLRGGES